MCEVSLSLSLSSAVSGWMDGLLDGVCTREMSSGCNFKNATGITSRRQENAFVDFSCQQPRPPEFNNVWSLQSLTQYQAHRNCAMPLPLNSDPRIFSFASRANCGSSAPGMVANCSPGIFSDMPLDRDAANMSRV
eukprot:COSAG02_NODE_17739_length_984_cov_1.290395_1_plen_135_part_00